MSFEICRKFEISSSHRLLGHGGGCGYIHGHNYVLSITFSSGSLDTLGMVADFSKIKDIIGGWLNDNWDHCMLANEKDEFVIRMNSLEENPFRKLYLFKGNPTAELMAKELCFVSQGLIFRNNMDIDVVKVRCEETSNSCSVYSTCGDYTEGPDEALD